jgi:hypothetical protein
MLITSPNHALTGSSTDGTGVYGSSFDGIGVYASGGPSSKPLVVQGAASQTANLQEWQSGGGAALSVVDKNGNFKIGTGSATSPTTRLVVNGGRESGVIALILVAPCRC